LTLVVTTKTGLKGTKVQVRTDLREVEFWSEFPWGLAANPSRALEWKGGSVRFRLQVRLKGEP